MSMNRNEERIGLKQLNSIDEVNKFLGAIFISESLHSSTMEYLLFIGLVREVGHRGGINRLRRFLPKLFVSEGWRLKYYFDGKDRYILSTENFERRYGTFFRVRIS